MADYAGGWTRGRRPALPEPQRLARLDDDALARERSADAERERERRRREASCVHRPRRLGRSQVVTCSLCGAQRLPPLDLSGAPSPAMPSTPERPPPEPAFPREAVRDLLGVARALRADAAARAPRAARVLAHYDAVIAELELALELGIGAREGSESARIARTRADHAALHVGDLLALTDSAGAVVEAAMRRVR